MWSSIKTDGIVLRTDMLRESDREYRVLTPLHGKLSVVGRGARKPRAKLAAHLEPCAILTLELVRGKRATTVINVERTHAFRRLFASLPHRLLTLTSLGILERVMHAEGEDTCMYADIVEWMRFLDAEEVVPPMRGRVLLAAFLLRVMERLGYRVSLSLCVSCAEPIVPLAFRWHAPRGGVVCTACCVANPVEWHSAEAMREEVLVLLRLLHDAPYPVLMRFALKADDALETTVTVHALLQLHVPGYPEEAFFDPFVFPTLFV